MSHDGVRPGHPFDGQFPVRHLDEHGVVLREAVSRQVRELAQRRSEPAFRRQLIRTLQRRRSGRELTATSARDETTIGTAHSETLSP